jgi:hypothetical protein
LVSGPRSRRTALGTNAVFDVPKNNQKIESRWFFESGHPAACARNSARRSGVRLAPKNRLHRDLTFARSPPGRRARSGSPSASPPFLVKAGRRHPSSQQEPGVACGLRVSARHAPARVGGMLGLCDPETESTLSERRVTQVVAPILLVRIPVRACPRWLMDIPSGGFGRRLASAGRGGRSTQASVWRAPGSGSEPRQGWSWLRPGRSRVGKRSRKDEGQPTLTPDSVRHRDGLRPSPPATTRNLPRPPRAAAPGGWSDSDLRDWCFGISERVDRCRVQKIGWG